MMGIWQNKNNYCERGMNNAAAFSPSSERFALTKGKCSKRQRLESLYGGQFHLFINSVDKPNFCVQLPHRRSNTHYSFFRKYALYSREKDTGSFKSTPH